MGGRRGRWWQAAVVGLIAAAVTLGVAELVVAVVGPASSPILAVAGWVVRLSPQFLMSFAIDTFGENDRLALVIGILVVVAVLAVAVGRTAMARPVTGLTAVGLLGLVGAVAAWTAPVGTVLDAVPSLVGAAAGAGALWWLLAARARWLADGEHRVRTARVGKDRLQTPDVATRTPAGRPGDAAAARVDRRRFLLAVGATAGTAVLAGGTGLALQSRLSVSADRSALRLPRPVSPAPALVAGADLSTVERLREMTSLFTDNDEFYLVQTAISSPQVRPNEYRLRIFGRVDNPITLTLDDLLDRDLIERDITLACVSNEVGGNLNGTARWLGVPLKPLLDEAGVHSSADQIYSTSVDGWTCSTPTAVALDGRDAMLAVGMNGEPLPIDHGFPVRMLVPGLYGFVSATKWITSIELTTYAERSAYWTDRDWATKAPVKTFSRIDLPPAGQAIPAGTTSIAGIAYAVHRGISKVEVRIDDQPWQEAELSPEDNPDLWRQWHLNWAAAAGEHTLTVRATDGDGKTQPEQRVPPIPDGATGWQQRLVTAT